VVDFFSRYTSIELCFVAVIEADASSDPAALTSGGNEVTILGSTDSCPNLFIYKI
jgi:hypothetical protein